MERDDQIFLQLDPKKEAVEFLLTEQPLGMIKGNFVSKDEIRHVVVTILVKIDPILIMVLKVEKHIE